MTLRDLQEASGLTYQAFIRYRQGQSQPSVAALNALAEAVGMQLRLAVEDPDGLVTITVPPELVGAVAAMAALPAPDRAQVAAGVEALTACPSEVRGAVLEMARRLRR